MFGRFGWTEILLIVLVFIILFGHKKISTVMKDIAGGINVFKKELKSEPKPEAPAKKSAKKTPVKKKTK